MLSHPNIIFFRYPVRDDLIVSTDAKGKQPLPLPEAQATLALPHELMNDAIFTWDFLNNFRLLLLLFHNYCYLYYYYYYYYDYYYYYYYYCYYFRHHNYCQYGYSLHEHHHSLTQEYRTYHDDVKNIIEKNNSKDLIRSFKKLKK